MSRTYSRRLPRAAAAVVLLIAALATLWFAPRTYRSLLLLQSAQAAGVPQVSTIRGWMTLDYLAQSYGVPRTALAGRLGLPDDSGADTLRTIAERRNVAPFDYVQRVQQTLAAMLPQRARDGPVGHDEGLMDWVLGALLAYGYPALALVLFFGAIGLPLPTGLSAVLSGSMVVLGHMQFVPVAIIAIGASLLGDMAGYGIGLWLDGSVLARYGRWVGYTRRRHARARALFDMLGGVTVVLTRTLVSSLSSLVNLFAGATRYRTMRFLTFAALGRALWALAYVGLGYVIAGDVESAAAFLRNLTGLLMSVTALLGIALYLARPALFAPAGEQGF